MSDYITRIRNFYLYQSRLRSSCQSLFFGPTVLSRSSREKRTASFIKETTANTNVASANIYFGLGHENVNCLLTEAIIQELTEKKKYSVSFTL